MKINVIVLFNQGGESCMNKYSVIRVSRNHDYGQSCTVEITFNTYDEASVFSSNLNRLYGNKSLNWVVDRY